jgi:hypothetical protein
MSKSFVECLEPDNTGMKDLKVVSRATSNNATFSIVFAGRIETFISTLDDLLRCIQAANATLEMIMRNKAS